MTIQNNVLAENCETLGNLYLLQSILQNMQTNLTLINEGAAGRVITVNNANLFQLAAKYYNDATLWTLIANANGLDDPFVSGGQLSHIMILNGGSGYINPVITFSNELVPANIFPRIVDGVITEISIQTGGNYSQLPEITITDDAGVGASATALCTMQLTIPQIGASTGGIL